MKKPVTSVYYLFILLFAFDSFGQAIDPALLENLSPEQIELAKSELAKSDFEDKTEPKTISESTIKIKRENEIDISDKKFGYSYFSSAPTSISAQGDLPLPNDYKISLNDQFGIILSGSKKAIFNLNVNLDGTILFPELGSISVVGETLEQVKTKLNNLVEQSYIGVQIDVSLKNLSAKKISIVGAVNSPGTYLVNPFTTISSALNYSGGISEIGSLRNINLKRSNGEVFIFDLYELLINGDRKNDITIESGDVIVVGGADQFVQIKGEVNRPSIYEVLETDSLNDIVNFALGFSPRANTKNIKITKLENDAKRVTSANAESMNTTLKNVLSVSVYSITSKENSNITILGAVKEPGLYNLSENKTLEELIDNIDFVDTYPWLAILEQFDELGLVKSSTLFNLEDITTFKGVNLSENSKVFFLNAESQSVNDCSFELDIDKDKDDGINDNKETLFECPNKNSVKLVNEYALKINHESKTYMMPVIGKFKLKRLLDLLGLDTTTVDKEVTYVNPLEDFVVQQDYRLLEAQTGKFHTVNFKSRQNDLINVTIRGAIDFPGSYTLRPGANLDDLYKLVGGFKEEAFVDAVIFRRESIKQRQIESIEKNRKLLRNRIAQMDDISAEKIQVLTTLSDEIDEDNLGRIAGNFNPSSKDTSKMILVNGDRVFIPYKSNTISVFGEVLNPISFEYSDEINTRTAIENAGGTTQFSDISRLYVIKANGLIEKPSRNLFARNISLNPGDTIVVPKKLPQENATLNALLPYTKVLSDLAFTAAALDNLSTN
jgi:protein involved in polysaccharide export with SLBB domain